MSDHSFDGYPTFEDWLYATRAKLSERIKDMTFAEQEADLKARIEPVMKEFGIKYSTLQPIIPYKRKRYPAPETAQ